MLRRLSPRSSHTVQPQSRTSSASSSEESFELNPTSAGLCLASHLRGTPADTEHICTLLLDMRDAHVHTLDLSGLTFSPNECAVLIGLLRQHPSWFRHITALNLRGATLCDAAPLLGALGQALAPQLQCLDVCGTGDLLPNGQPSQGLPEASLQALAALIQQCHHLTALNLSHQPQLGNPWYDYMSSLPTPGSATQPRLLPTILDTLRGRTIHLLDLSSCQLGELDLGFLGGLLCADEEVTTPVHVLRLHDNFHAFGLRTNATHTFFCAIQAAPACLRELTIPHEMVKNCAIGFFEDVLRSLIEQQPLLTSIEPLDRSPEPALYYVGALLRERKAALANRPDPWLPPEHREAAKQQLCSQLNTHQRPLALQTLRWLAEQSDELDLSECTMNWTGVHLLIHLLQRWPFLAMHFKRLQLQNCQMEDLDYFIEQMAKLNTTLEEINISGLQCWAFQPGGTRAPQPPSASDSKKLMAWLKQSSDHLKCLRLNGCLDSYILTHLSSLERLEHLELRDIPPHKEWLPHDAHTLLVDLCKSIKHVDLRGNAPHFNTWGDLAWLIEDLPTNSALERLLLPTLAEPIVQRMRAGDVPALDLHANDFVRERELHEHRLKCLPAIQAWLNAKGHVLVFGD